jgi:two-component system CheB/CheR fusion protein
VSLRRDGSDVELCIADSGIGIEPDMLDGVFELFVQSNSPAEGIGGGMGVGLTLVKQLVELHGGTVRATSAGEGKGSVFTVRLPFANASPSVEFVEAPESKLRSPDETRVVLVEDNAEAREMLQEMLQLDGFQVDVAADGAKGLALILKLSPDVALVDIGLPELDGYHVAQAVRSSRDHDVVRLVALTGYGQDKDRKAVKKAGFDEHLVKPVDPDELDRVLRRTSLGA